MPFAAVTWVGPRYHILNEARCEVWVWKSLRVTCNWWVLSVTCIWQSLWLLPVFGKFSVLPVFDEVFECYLYLARSLTVTCIWRGLSVTSIWQGVWMLPVFGEVFECYLYLARCLIVTCTWRGLVHSGTLSVTCRPSCTWWQFSLTYSLQIWCCSRLRCRVSCSSRRQHEQPLTWPQHAEAECSRLPSHEQCSPADRWQQLQHHSVNWRVPCKKQICQYFWFLLP